MRNISSPIGSLSKRDYSRKRQPSWPTNWSLTGHSRLGEIFNTVIS